MRIVVGGYIVSFPLGGMTWHHLHYLLGLHELGHEVWFYEFGSWPPYNPRKQYCERDASYGLDYLRRQFDLFDLPQRWSYHAPWCGWQNMSETQVDDVLASADLLICVSGVTPLHQLRRRPKRTLVIDTDPVFTQLRMRDDAQLRDYYNQFDSIATFGSLIGKRGCDVPTHGLNWNPTRQPVVLKHWPLVAPPSASRRLTTIGKWEHSGRNVEWDGRQWFSSKGVEWLKVIDLPQRTTWEMHLGMQSMPCLGREHFEAHGWRWIDPELVSADCDAFRQFVQSSAGEFTVVKNLYAGLKSGWFSDRSACYLASGRPVVTQSTGFEEWLSTGEGVLSFQTAEDAAAALEDLQRNYHGHARAARNLAEQHFDSNRVLRELLERVI